MTPTSKQCTLKIKEGKYVTVMNLDKTMTLCAVDLQMEPSVTICTRVRNERNQMALQFHHLNVYYLPKVNEDSVQLEMTVNNKILATDAINESHWFEKVDEKGSEHYTLQSVVHPRKYLSTSSIDKRRSQFVLGEHGIPVTNV